MHNAVHVYLAIKVGTLFYVCQHLNVQARM